MISPNVARAQTNHAITQKKALARVKRAAAARKRRAAIAAAEAARPLNTLALNKRIDAAVDRYISEVAEPCIVDAAADGKASATLEGHSWNKRLPVDEIALEEFGEMWDREKLIRATSLASQSIEWWGGCVQSRPVSMQYHILHRVGSKLQALGYNVSLPVIERRAGCKVDQHMRPLYVRW